MCAEFNLLETRNAVVACYINAIGKGLEEESALDMAAKLMVVRHPYLAPQEIESQITDWIEELCAHCHCKKPSFSSCLECKTTHKNCFQHKSKETSKIRKKPSS